MISFNHANKLRMHLQPASPASPGGGAAIDRYVSFMNWTITVALLGSLIATLFGMYLVKVGVRLNPAFSLRFGIVLFLFLGTAYYARRGERRAYHLWLIASWITLATNLHLLPMFLAGRHETPFVDETLAGWDRLLGLEAVDVVAWMRRHPSVDYCLGLVYGSLLLLITAGVIIVPLAGRTAAALENIVAIFISVLIAFPIFATFRAHGPWRYYGYTPFIDQRGYEAQLAALQAPDWYMIDFRYTEGLICFPSYHTILAVLAAVALSHVRYLGPAAFLWAGLIVVSTVTTGSHYLVDVLAGLAVASVSSILAKFITRRALRRIESTAHGSPRDVPYQESAFAQVGEA